MSKTQDLIEAFRSLSIPEQRAFFEAVSRDMEFPAVVRDIAAKGAGELADYMDFHGVAA